MDGRLIKFFSANKVGRISCTPPLGHPEPVVWWEKDGARVPSKGRVYQQDRDLIFSPATARDSGTYICMAQNKAGQRRQEVSVTVAGEDGRIITRCSLLFKTSNSDLLRVLPRTVFCSMSYENEHRLT